jgi:hypothetical protein
MHKKNKNKNKQGRKSGMVKVDLNREELDQVNGGFYQAVSGGFNGGALDPPTLPTWPGFPPFPPGGF